MANNTRDVAMTLSVETLGAEDIKKLQTTVSNLAKEGGDAAPEFQRLADEIGRLGQQADALRAFTLLTEQTAELAQRQEQASVNSAELRTRLDALTAVTTDAAERQRAVATALEAAQKAARDSRDELARLTAETDRAGKAESGYIAEVTRLKLAKIEQRAEIERLSVAMVKANAEVKEAERVENQLAASYSKAEAAAAKAAQAVRDNANAVRTAAETARQLDVATDNVATAQAQLVQALNRTGASAGQLRADITRLADAERELEAIRVFEKQAAEATRLVRATEYLDFFERALREAAEAERVLAQQDADARWQREAEAIVDAAHAAQELARQSEILAAAQRELAAQRAFEQQAEDARRLIEAADYVRQWEEQLRAAEEQARATAEAAQRAGERISGAFDTLGIRSAQSLEEEIGKVRAAMRTVENQAGLTGAELQNALDAGNTRIADLERQIRDVNGELTAGDQLAGLFANSIGQIAAGNLIADGVGSLIEKVKELAVQFVATIVETQNLRRALFAVYGDTRIVSQQFAFLKATANDAGVAIGDIVQSFVKFSAATKASGINLDVTNKLFKEVTRTAGVLGLSGEQVTGMLEALGQMASKGTVSMEELRQQLGDRLPGALSLVAKGLGLTEAGLVKLVETGGLAASDLFPALTSALGEMKGEATGLSSAWQRFKNVLTETAQSAGDAGWTEALGGALKGLAVIVGILAIAFSAISEVIGVVARSAGVLVSALVNLTNPIEELGDIVETAGKRHDKLATSILGMASNADAAKAATDAHTTAMEDAGTAAAEETLAVQSTTLAMEAAAFARKLSADSTLDLSSRIVQLKAHIDTLLGAQESQIDADARLAKAAKIQGDAMVQLAELRGKDFLSLEAQTKASADYATALEKVAVSQRTETELLVLKREEIVRTAIAQAGNTKARQAEIDAIEKKIETSKSETEQTKQAADAARQDAQQRELSAKAYRDNSASVGEFRKALEMAEATLVKMIEAEKNGYGTKEQVAEATKRVAEAQYLYNDAIEDSIKELDRATRAEQALINLQETKLQLEKKGLEALAQAARASGDYEGALRYEIEARIKQIEIIALTSQAKKLEAEATIKAIEIERAALDLADPLLKQKQAELDIRLLNAKAKLLEANAGKIAIDALEREIALMRSGNNERKNESSGRDKNAQSIDRETEALKKKVSAMYDEQNFALDSNGKRITASGDPNPYRSNGDWVYVDKAGQMRRSSKQPVKDPAGGYMDPDNAPRGVIGAGNGLPKLKAGGGTSAKSAGDVAPPNVGETNIVSQGGGSKTVNITINGRNTPVGVSSEDDANALTSVLRQLENASGTAR